MKRATLFGLLTLATTVGGGCGEDGLTSGGPGGGKDMAAAVFPGDAAVPPDQAGDAGPANLCGDHDPGCQEFSLGPEYNKPFPLPGDPQPDPAAASDRVRRSPDGWLARRRWIFASYWDSASQVASVFSSRIVRSRFWEQSAGAASTSNNKVTAGWARQEIWRRR